ncbi:hypothetical protein [Pseudomonas sp. NPDC087817]|uniref:hypothetical protein n=1 Tax=Pseudomonas sp. NPDC087817 TaxID=3364451 RepID=UPI0037FC6FAD
MNSTIEAVAAQVGDAKRVAVFTGAGTYAEIGIPTFCDPLPGIWVGHDPKKLETASAFREDVVLV